MRNIALTFLMVGVLLGISSCCTKKRCIGADNIYEINFYNFSETNLDTITIISYAKNSNFSTIIDSSVTQANKSGDYFSAYTIKKINTALDYKIKLISTRQVYTLTDFEVKKVGCNSCFPYRPESDFYNELNGYHLNKQRQTGSQIKIYK
ncbi:MAG TPA: hypothetical protein PLQ78_07005 [Flavipsychrobacter sp.]|nr:hypothetical protein [Flavipsychrobacter sp.]